MGIAGGLVPSPTALIVLAGAVGLGKTWFGVVLVLCYGPGMAAALTVAGLVLVSVRDRLARTTLSDRAGAWAGRAMVVLPLVTAAVVVLVGAGLALRSLVGPL